MADSGFRPAPRPKNILDHNKLNLRAPNSTGKMASLQWQLINSNPRIVVYTNDPNDTADYGKVSANIDGPTLFALFRLVEEAVNSPGAYRKKIDNLGHSFQGGKRSESPSVISSTIISKDDEGLISLMISAPRRPQIKFPFINPEFHHFIHTDGSPFTKVEASKLFALAYLDMLKGVYAALMVKNYVEPPPRDESKDGWKPGGQGRNSNQARANDGGSNNRQASATRNSGMVTEEETDTLLDVPGW